MSSIALGLLLVALVGWAYRKRPIALAVWLTILFIVFVLIGGDRDLPDSSSSQPQTTNVDIGSIGRDEVAVESESMPDEAGVIDRTLLIPPGMRAREYIARLKEQGEPYPLDEARDKAAAYQEDGSLADAYLLYFFAAREGHGPSMLEIARLNDPRYFKPDNALLDEPDAVQALKWYRLAQQAGDEQAVASLESLRGWAEDEAAFIGTGN